MLQLAWRSGGSVQTRLSQGHAHHWDKTSALLAGPLLMTAGAAAQFSLYCRRRRGSPPTFPSGAAAGRGSPGRRLRSGRAVPQRPRMRREAAWAPRLAARLPFPLSEPGARIAAPHRSLQGTAGRAASPLRGCFGLGGQRPREAAAAPHAAPVRPSVHLRVGGGSCVRGCV